VDCNRCLVRYHEKASVIARVEEEVGWRERLLGCQILKLIFHFRITEALIKANDFLLLPGKDGCVLQLL